MFQHLAPTASDPTMCYADPVNPATPERSGRCYRTATDTAFIVLETTHIKFDNFYMLGHVGGASCINLGIIHSVLLKLRRVRCDRRVLRLERLARERFRLG